jgi:hypothetical protein
VLFNEVKDMGSNGFRCSSDREIIHLAEEENPGIVDYSRV